LSGTRQKKVAVTAPSDGDGSFAECLLWHSAKRPILPSVCYHGPRQRPLQWAPPPVPVPRALVGTRQRRLLCRVSSGLALGKESSSGPLCQSLCRVRWTALGKGSFFVECLDHSTRQRRLYRFPGVLLCRVLWHSAKIPFAECYTRQSDHEVPFLFVFTVPSKQTKDISFTSHYISFASQNQHIYYQHHIYQSVKARIPVV
jgi:hypothetical protein